MRRGVVHAREDASQRAGESFDLIGDDGKPEGRETRGVAIGVEDERRALGIQPLDEPRENRPAADLDQPLVDAAEPPGEAAGEDDSDWLHHEKTGPPERFTLAAARRSSSGSVMKPKPQRAKRPRSLSAA